MSQNLGTADRIARVTAAVAMFGASIAVSMPLWLTVALALTGVYMLGSSLVGTCLGYRLIGVSTCPVKPKRVGGN